MKKFVVLSVLSFGLLGINQSQANILFSTNFNGYANGNIVGQDNWAAHSGSGSLPVQVVNGAFVLNQGSGSREDVNHGLGATMGAGDTWYYSFDVSVSGGNTSVYFAMFLQGTTIFDGRLYVTSFSGSDFTFGIGGSSLGPTWASGFSFNTVNKIVVSYDYTSKNATLWVNPTSSGSTSITYNTGYSDAVTAIAFRQAAGNSVETIDNLVVGTTFNDVVPVPEPSTVALGLVGGLAGLVALRRKR
jgi:hypothetical protein